MKTAHVVYYVEGQWHISLMTAADTAMFTAADTAKLM